ncbi:MAG TPA: hypothetical protein VKA92_09620 [Segetibacter sp.]|nr:hypothetical protein [Segetibacter sp.]
MNDKEQDPQLQAPQEANTTKHINFLELEEGYSNTAERNDSAEDDSPTRKAWEELRRENSNRNAGNG